MTGTMSMPIRLRARVSSLVLKVRMIIMMRVIRTRNFKSIRFIRCVGIFVAILIMPLVVLMSVPMSAFIWNSRPERASIIIVIVGPDAIIRIEIGRGIRVISSMGIITLAMVVVVVVIAAMTSVIIRIMY